MGDYVGYIYCITNNINGKKYVGQTSTTVRKRYVEHVRCARAYEDTTQLLYRAMRKYGIDNFCVETIDSVSANSRDELKDMLNELEQYYVSKLNTYKPNGYNMTIGGFAFADHVVRPVFMVDADGNIMDRFDSMADAELSIGIPLGSIKRAFMYSTHYANGWYWYDASNQHLNIGDNIGKQCCRSKRVYCFTMSGEFVEEYESAFDAEKKTGISHQKIALVCNNERISSGGYRWQYSMTPSTRESTRRTCRAKPVTQMTMDGDFVATYASSAEASRQTGLQESLIAACCRGKRKSTGGYRWAFSIT